MQNDVQKRNFKQKNIDAEYFYDIVWRDFARWVILTGQLRNPWQTLAELAEPLGSAEPRLKITALLTHSLAFNFCVAHNYSRWHGIDVTVLLYTGPG